MTVRRDPLTSGEGTDIVPAAVFFPIREIAECRLTLLTQESVLRFFVSDELPAAERLFVFLLLFFVLFKKSREPSGLPGTERFAHFSIKWNRF